MSIKNIFDPNYWDFNKIVAFLTLLLAIVAIIFQISPSILFPSNIEYNDNINFKKNILFEEEISFLENNGENTRLDTTESIEIETNDPLNRNVILKLKKTSKPERRVFAFLADPMGIIRYTTSPIDENSNYTLFLKNLDVISVDKYVTFPLPNLNEYDIAGTWNFYIYIYNSENQLTTVISRPVNINSSTNNSSGSDLVYVLVGVLSVSFSLFLLHSQLKKIQQDTSPLALPEKETVREDEQNKIVQNQEFRVEGIIVWVTGGLITKCGICGLQRERGRCPTHGEGKWEHDLAAEFIFFDGFKEHILLINRPIIEKMLDMDLESCVSVAFDALDSSVINTLLSKKLIGTYFSVVGVYNTEGISVKEIIEKKDISLHERLILYDRWKNLQSESLS